MTLSIGVVLRIAAVVGAVIIAALTPGHAIVWLGLDVAVLGIGTLVP